MANENMNSPAFKASLVQMQAHLKDLHTHIIKYFKQLAEELPNEEPALRRDHWKSLIVDTLFGFASFTNESLLNTYFPQGKNIAHVKMACDYITLLNAKKLPANIEQDSDLYYLYCFLNTPGAMIPEEKNNTNETRALMESSYYVGEHKNNIKYNVTALVSTMTKIIMLSEIIENYDTTQEFINDNPDKVNKEFSALQSLNAAWLQKQFDEIRAVVNNPQEYIKFQKPNGKITPPPVSKLPAPVWQGENIAPSIAVTPPPASSNLSQGLEEMDAHLGKLEDYILGYFHHVAKNCGLPQVRVEIWDNHITATLHQYQKSVVETALLEKYLPKDAKEKNEKYATDYTYGMMAFHYLTLLSSTKLPAGAIGEIEDAYIALHKPGRQLQTQGMPIIDNILIDEKKFAGLEKQYQRYDVTALATTLTKITMLRVLTKNYNTIQKYIKNNAQDVNSKYPILKTFTPEWLQKQFNKIQEFAEKPQDHIILEKPYGSLYPTAKPPIFKAAAPAWNGNNLIEITPGTTFFPKKKSFKIALGCALALGFLVGINYAMGGALLASLGPIFIISFCVLTTAVVVNKVLKKLHANAVANGHVHIAEPAPAPNVEPAYAAAVDAILSGVLNYHAQPVNFAYPPLNDPFWAPVLPAVEPEVAPAHHLHHPHG